MKHILNGEQEGRFTGPKRRFMDQEGRFAEILDVVTTALLADMERARWSGCPTVCADYQGHGFDFTVYVNREGTADSAIRQRREQRESSVGDISENRVAHMGRPG
jgi:hypothetical protein